MFNLKNFVVSVLDALFLPVQTPPTPQEPRTEPIARVTEEQLRAVYRLGRITERKSLQEAGLLKEAEILDWQDAIAMLKTAPLAHETGPNKPISKAGGVMRAEKAIKRTEKKLGTSIPRRWSPPARPQSAEEQIERKPIFASVPTVLELPALGKDE